MVERRFFSHRYNLTIIIPVFNQERYLRECLDSVLSQISTFSCHIICVDDGSNDNSADILDELFFYENRNNNFDAIVVHHNNCGLSGARNTGISLIDSDYVMFLDSDDRLLPNSIENLLLEAYSKTADVVEGNGYRFNETGKIGSIKTNSDELTGFACIKIFRQELWERIEFPCNYLFEDTIVSTLIYPLCQIICTIPNDIYEYRVHQGTITNGSVRPKLLDSVWIMIQTCDDRKKLGLESNVKYYDFLLNHIELTIRWRVAGFPNHIKFDILEVIRYFLETECSDIFHYKKMNRRQRLFITALRKRQYKKCIYLFSE